MKRFWVRIEGHQRKEPKGVWARKLPARITINQPQTYNTFTIITTNNTMEALSRAELTATTCVVPPHVFVMRHSAKALARERRHNPLKDYFHWEMTTVPKGALPRSMVLRLKAEVHSVGPTGATKPIARFLADEDWSEGLLRLPTSIGR